MADAGAVSYMFHKKGEIIVPKSAIKEDDLMALVLDAGAEDLRDDGENWEVLCETSAYEAVLEAVKKANIEPTSSQVTMIPANYIKLEGPAASTMSWAAVWRAVSMITRPASVCWNCTNARLMALSWAHCSGVQ